MTATTFQIGQSSGLRAGRGGIIASADGLDLSGVYLPSTDGAQAVAALRQQFAGYFSDTEVEYVPVICSSDSSLNGFYKVESAEVGEVGPHGSGVAVAWRVRLSRLSPSHRLPVQDCPGTYVLRTNEYSITGPDGQWSVPATAIAANAPDGFSINQAPVTRTADTGALKTLFYTASATAAASQAHFLVDPDDYYVGAAKLESKLDGSTYYPIVGRQAPITPGNWRLNNGLIRLTGSATAGVLFAIQAYNGTSWGTVSLNMTTSYRNQVATDASLLTATDAQVSAVQVLRNSPAVVSLRLWWSWTSASAGASVPSPDALKNLLKNYPRAMDVTLRRGDRLASCYISTGGTAYTLFSEHTGAATTSITGGTRFTSNDADGNRFVQANLDNGGTYPGRGSPWGWGIGFEIGGSSATGKEAAQEIAYQYYGALSERQRVAL